MDKLISAKELAIKQETYLKEVDNFEMQDIIKVLNEAYKSQETHYTFPKISQNNVDKLKESGYTVTYYGDQREGYWYKVSWENPIKDTYNITFTLGDTSDDGHGLKYTYHITSNYSVSAIQEAYNKASKMLGFDYVNEVCSEYEEGYYIEPRITSTLLKYNCINHEYVTIDGKYFIDCNELNFVEIFFKIVSIILPDIVWGQRDLQEECLFLLDGAGYGLFIV